MRRKGFLLIGISVTVIVIISGVSFSLFNNNEKLNTESLPELEFSYDDSNLKLKQNLDSKKISMSSPIKLIGRNQLDEYCTFFENKELQNQIEYCTSTELRNFEGNYLGNIHMVGNRQMPKIILVVIQSNPFMQNLDDIKTVFGVVIEDLVCDCWNGIQPSGIKTISEWIDKQRDFHKSDTKPTSKSSLTLSGMQLQMELTTNTQGYLWKLIISG